MPLKHHSIKNTIEAGCDEAGRGCLAGPVFAAAVILPPKFKNNILDDSKKLSHTQRASLRSIIENETQWAVASCTPTEIDKYNILNASILAMHRALDLLHQKYTIQAQHIIVDGNRFKKYNNIPHTTIVKGDGLFMSIAAASVLAKTHRDEYMTELHTHFPHYTWDRNMGYPTIKHREGIANVGPCEHHRKSFTLLPPQFVLF